MVKRGKPTVLLLNENFLVEAKIVARSRGVPDLPYVVFPHNLETLPIPDIKAAIDRVFPQIVNHLVKPPG